VESLIKASIQTSDFVN